MSSSNGAKKEAQEKLQLPGGRVVLARPEKLMMAHLPTDILSGKRRKELFAEGTHKIFLGSEGRNVSAGARITSTSGNRYRIIWMDNPDGKGWTWDLIRKVLKGEE